MPQISDQKNAAQKLSKIVLEVYITYWSVANILYIAKNLGKIMIYGECIKNGSLYYVLECRKCFVEFLNAIKKEGQKSENKVFLSPIFVSGD